MCVCMRACACVCMRACACVCMCVRVCVCICVSMCYVLFFCSLQVRAVTSVGPGEYSDCHLFEVMAPSGMFIYPSSLVLYILCL